MNSSGVYENQALETSDLQLHRIEDKDDGLSVEVVDEDGTKVYPIRRKYCDKDSVRPHLHLTALLALDQRY